MKPVVSQQHFETVRLFTLGWTTVIHSMWELIVPPSASAERILLLSSFICCESFKGFAPPYLSDLLHPYTPTCSLMSTAPHGAQNEACAVRGSDFCCVECVSVVHYRLLPNLFSAAFHIRLMFFIIRSINILFSFILFYFILFIVL